MTDEVLYTEKQLEDLVARKLTEQQLHVMERRFGSLEQSITATFADMRSTMSALERTIDKHNQQVDKCRADLKDEIEKDFATKEELHQLRADFRVLTAKITTAVAVATVLIQLGFKVWG